MPNDDKLSLQEAMDQKSLYDAENVVQFPEAPALGYEGSVRPDIEDFLDRDTHKPDIPASDAPLKFYDDVKFMEVHFNKLFASVLEGNQERINGHAMIIQM
jgi:hypothetical protein